MTTTPHVAPCRGTEKTLCDRAVICQATELHKADLRAKSSYFCLRYSPPFMQSELNDKSTCPTCGKRFRMDETNAPPFCSQRCQLIDLGRWLDEEIGLPQETDESPKTIDPDLTR